MGNLTVNYTTKNVFLKDASEGGMSERTPMLATDMTDGSTSKKIWKRNMLPGASRTKIIKYDEGKRQYPISMSDEELNEIVKALNFTDDNDQRILKADRYNKYDPFFCHEDLKFKIASDVEVVDDEDPMILLFSDYFKTDSSSGVNFYDETKSNKLRTQSTVLSDLTIVKDKTYDQAQAEEEMATVEKALNIVFSELSSENQANMLMAMGISNVSKANPDTIRQKLVDVIVNQKDELSINREDTNLEYFYKLNSKKDTELVLMGIFQNARSSQIVFKKAGTYVFGSIKLGNTIKSCYKFLADPVNEDVLTSLKEAIDSRSDEK